MFGKRNKMSTNERAIMAIGRKVGNLKGTNVGNTRGPSNAKSGKPSINPFRVKKASPGTSGPVKLGSS